MPYVGLVVWFCLGGTEVRAAMVTRVQYSEVVDLQVFWCEGDPQGIATSFCAKGEGYGNWKFIPIGQGSN